MKLIKNKNHNVIKRNGNVEKYNKNKMRKVLKWAVEKAEIEHFGKITSDNFTNSLIDEILKDTQIKIYDKIHITKLFDEIIKTTENKICEIQPIWDKIAKNLLIQKYYKDVWGIKRNEYPDYSLVVAKGKQYKVLPYVKIFESFSEEEINELGKMIVAERDFGLTSLGIKTFMSKYALKYSKNKFLELPQHTLLRLAIKSFINEPKDERLKLIKERYEDLSNSIFSEATPRYNDTDMEASCVLMKTGDDSWSILRMLEAAGLYSKHGGGTAVDVSAIRAVGSKIGVSGESDGIIPFIKMTEAIISGFKQGNIRRGACAVYFDWWHYEVQDLIMLKDEGGNEEKRARKLQFGIKLNDLLIERLIGNTKYIKNDDKITILTNPNNEKSKKEFSKSELKKHLKENNLKEIYVKTKKGNEIKYVKAYIDNL